MEILGETPAPLPAFAARDGRRFVLGTVGVRYRIRLVNPTPSRMEAVVSVDGLDVLDGKPANLGKDGYIVPAFGEITIDGWRTSLDEVAAFRFSPIAASYAARTEHARNVGVIGAAFFRERPPPVTWNRPFAASPPSPRAAPGAAGGAAHDSRAAGELSGIGTRFGESHESHVEEVSFTRAEARPTTLTEVRYDDREGLLARGIPLPPLRDRWADLGRRDSAEPFAETRFAQPPR